MEKITREMITDVINKKDVPLLREYFEEYNNIDLAGIINDLPVEKILFIFKTVPASLSAEVFTYLE
ncbi:TPA: hypothetical protein GXZ34_02015, partial [bacterium]|nr:hypothetical protein [bacterium]